MTTGFGYWLRRLWGRSQHGLGNLFLLAATLAFGIGIFAPMITLTKMMLIHNTFSIVSGIWQLYLNGEYPLFGILVVFTLVLPVIKLGLLFYAWNRPRTAHERSLRWMEMLGKWSMLDVFVVAILIMSVKLSPLAKTDLHYGLYLFSAAVVMTMIGSQVVYRKVRNVAREAGVPGSSC